MKLPSSSWSDFSSFAFSWSVDQSDVRQVNFVRDAGTKGKTEAAAALRNLALRPQYREIGEAGGIEALVELVRHGDAEGRIHAAGALRNLTVTNSALKSRGKVAAGAILKSLSKSNRAVRGAYGHDSTVMKEHAVRVGLADGVEALVDLIRVSNAEGKTQAVAALWNLTLWNQTQPSIVQTGGIGPLVELMQNKDPVLACCKAIAASVLFAVCTSDDAEHEIRMLGYSRGQLFELTGLIPNDDDV